MPIKHYNYNFIAFIGLNLMLIGLLNWLVNPYAIFDTPRFSNLNERKPAATTRAALSKTYAVEFIQPNTLILGNSRPEMGLDPTSACWAKQQQPVYSFTFPGSGTYPQVRALFHAAQITPLKHLYWGIDFPDFLLPRSLQNTSDWPELTDDFYARLRVRKDLTPNTNAAAMPFKDYRNALFSIDALADSLTTLFSQGHTSSTRTAEGFNPADDFKAAVKAEGPWVLFAQKRATIAEGLARPNLSLYNHDQWSVERESVKRGLEFSKQKQIQLSLFINPYHLDYLTAIYASGYWPQFEQFKRDLVEQVSDAEGVDVLLWDFAILSEPVITPAPNRHSPKVAHPWFWEPSHYNRELGELMLASLTGNLCGQPLKTPIGTLLTRSTIEQHLIQQRQAIEGIMQTQELKQ